MTDTYDLLRQSEQFRQRVATMEMQATGVLGAAYADVLTQLEGRLDALERRIAERQAAGEPFSPSWLFQQDRYREMIRQTRQLMTQYGQTTATVTTAAQQAAVRAALVDAGRQVAAVAGGSGETSQMVAGWAAVPDRTVQSMVGALQESTPLGELLSEFGPDAVADVNRALVRGVGLGLGASDMTRAVVAALGISRARAESIVRTESMRAARTATLAAYKESGVVQGWRWSASLSARTCSACLSRHGNVYPLDVPMQSHQQCRCSASPWLGNDRDVPWESGEEWLARQSKSVQETVLGKEGASLFSGGQLRLSDYERVTPNARWGESVTSGGTAWAKRQAAKAGRPVAGSGRQPQWKPAMSRDEADRWAANSVLQAPLYHGTSSAASARSISENGFDLSIRTNGRAYGDGVYLTGFETVADTYAKLSKSGGTTLQLRVNVQNVHTIPDEAEHDLIRYVAASHPNGKRLIEINNEIRKQLGDLEFEYDTTALNNPQRRAEIEAIWSNPPFYDDAGYSIKKWADEEGIDAFDVGGDRAILVVFNPENVTVVQ